MRKILLVLAVTAGLLIAYVDSHPNWDDTAITAFSILLICGLLGFFNPRQPWVWALAVGIWVPLWSVVVSHNYGGLIALVFAFAGAYTGMAVRRLVNNQST